MSISLKNHEDRITMLEKGASNSVMKTVVLAEVNKDVIPSTIIMSDVIDNYDMIVFKSGYDNSDAIMFSFHLPKYLPSNKNIRLSGTDAHAYHGKFSSDRKSITLIGESNYLYNVIGLKWGGGINLGILLQRLLVYIKTYSKLFHLQFLEVK